MIGMLISAFLVECDAVFRLVKYSIIWWNGGLPNSCTNIEFLWVCCHWYGDL